MTRLRSRLLPMLALLALILVPAGVASAHAEYDRSDPANGATVTTAPLVVTIWTTEELDTKATTAKVTGPDGQRVDAGARVSLDDATHKLMLITLKPNLAPGTYTVAWHTVSAADGDAADGTFTFKVAAAVQTPAPTPTTPAPTTPAPPTSTTPSQSSAPTQSTAPARTLPNTGTGLPLVAVAGAGLLIAGLALRRRK